MLVELPLFKWIYGSEIDAMVENIGSNRVIQKCGGIFVKTENVFRPLKNSNVLVNRYIVKAE